MSKALGAIIAFPLLAGLVAGCERSAITRDLSGPGDPSEQQPLPVPTGVPTPGPSTSPSPAPSNSPSPIAHEGSLLFADNFDASPNWASQQTVHKSVGGTDRAWPTTFAKACTATCPPEGWTAYRTAASYFTDNPGLDTFVLSEQGQRGGGAGSTGATGKGITRNSESSGSYGSWEGGSLDLSLGAQGHPELLVRFWLKYDPAWLWTDPENTQHSLQKLIRISRFSGDINDYQQHNPHMYFSPTENGPSWMPDWYYNHSYGTTTFFSSEFFNPQPSGSIGYGPTQNYAELHWPADGQWHLYEFRVKMNSAAGVADGEWEIWIDGGTGPDKHAVKRTVLWVDATGSLTPGWNYLMFLDNVTVAPAPVSARKEMQMYLDDVVVYTPRQLTDPACGGSCTADGRLPVGFVVPKVSNL